MHEGRKARASGIYRMVAVRAARYAALVRCFVGLSVLGVASAAPFAFAQEQAPKESDSYAITSVPGPANAQLEVGGLGFAPDGSLFVCTRRGEVWVRRGASTPKGRATLGVKPAFAWSLFAEGLHEPLGIHVVSTREAIVAQRPELTRLKDTNNDGVADEFSTVTAAFGVSGNFHEYHYGPVVDKAGNLYGTLNVAWTQHADSSVPYRGWAYKVTPDGKFVPLASGFRSPAGLGLSPEGELFATDNQGDWWPTSPLLHVRPGHFYGNPAGLRWEAGYTGPKDSYELPAATLEQRRTLPALWFVYGTLGHSPTEPVWDTSHGKFGPFAGQMFVGDQTNSAIMRIALEKVNGEYQGAAFAFRSGLGSGITRMAMGPDNALYVGGTDRGWGAIGGKPYALEAVRFTGKTPFEMLAIAAQPDGFLIKFTQPARASDLKDAVTITHHTYRYWRNYGSPHVDVTNVVPTSATWEDGGKALRLRLPKMEATRVYAFKLRNVTNDGGAPLLHDEAYYTLTQVPRVAAMGATP